MVLALVWAWSHHVLNVSRSQKMFACNQSRPQVSFSDLRAQARNGYAAAGEKLLDGFFKSIEAVDHLWHLLGPQ